MPDMRVCRTTGALIFTPTAEELEMANLKKELKSSIEEVKEIREELRRELEDLRDSKE